MILSVLKIWWGSRLYWWRPRPRKLTMRCNHINFYREKKKQKEKKKGEIWDSHQFVKSLIARYIYLRVRLVTHPLVYNFCTTWWQPAQPASWLDGVLMWTDFSTTHEICVKRKQSRWLFFGIIVTYMCVYIITMFDRVRARDGWNLASWLISELHPYANTVLWIATHMIVISIDR